MFPFFSFARQKGYSSSFKNQNMKPLLQILSFITISFFIVSCDTTIPAMDTTPPQISIAINGPGVNRTISNQDIANGIQINLQRGQDYNITAIASDAGGVSSSSLSIGLTGSFVTLNEFSVSGGPVIPPVISGISNVFRASGNASMPKTGIIIQGSFRTNILNTAFSIEAGGYDFGGMGGTRSSKFLMLNLVCAERGEILNL